MEYALLMALIAIACVGALQFFGSQSGNSLDSSGAKIVAAG